MDTENFDAEAFDPIDYDGQVESGSDVSFDEARLFQC